MQDHVSFGRAVFRKKADGFAIQLIHLHGTFFGASGDLRDLAPLRGRLGGLVHQRLRRVGLCQVVESLSALDLTFQFGYVSQVVQRKRIVGVNEIRLVEVLLGVIDAMLFQRVHAVTIKLLHRRVLAFLGQRNAQVLRSGRGNQGAAKGQKDREN